MYTYASSDKDYESPQAYSGYNYAYAYIDKDDGYAQDYNSYKYQNYNVYSMGDYMNADKSIMTSCTPIVALISIIYLSFQRKGKQVGGIEKNLFFASTSNWSSYVLKQRNGASWPYIVTMMEQFDIYTLCN